MSERRSDEETSLAVEYALFLSETRGLNSGLTYLAQSGIKEDILRRAVEVADARRRHNRRSEGRD
jgi:hypothetical protein